MIKRYPFPNSKAFRIGFGLFLFAMLYLARDTNVTLYLLGFNKSQFLALGLMGILGIAFLWQNRRNLKQILLDGRVLIAIGLSACILIPMVLKRDWQLMYFSVLSGILLAVLLSYFLSCREAAKYYVCILSGLAVWSLLAAYLFRIPADRGMLVPPTFANAFGAEFYNYLLSFVSVTFSKDRNFGIFREPGVYQFFLMLGLYLNNYKVDWQRERRMWIVNGILALTMLSTFSTGGVAAMGLFAVVVYFDKKVYRSKLGRILTACFFGAAVLVGAYLVIAKPRLYTTLYLMVNKVFSGDNSANERWESIWVNWHILSFSPYKGRDFAYVLHVIENNTSSSMILYAVFGKIFGNLNVIAWICLLWEKKRNILWNLLCIVLMFATFNTENLVADVFLWLFPVMALTEGILSMGAKCSSFLTHKSL